MNFIKVSCLIAQAQCLTNWETKRRHSRAVKWRQRSVQECVMHVQSYCFANLIKPIVFLPFLSPSPPSLLKLPPSLHESPLVQWQSTKISTKHSTGLKIQSTPFIADTVGTSS